MFVCCCFAVIVVVAVIIILSTFGVTVSDAVTQHSRTFVEFMSEGSAETLVQKKKSELTQGDLLEM